MKLMKAMITPFTIGSFFVMAVTGMLMFFHLNTGLNKFAHEWLSWVFVAAVLLHTVFINKRSFLSYFKRVGPVVAIGLFMTVPVLTYLAGNEDARHPFQRVARTLYHADLPLVSQLLNISDQQLKNRLEGQGLVTTPLDTSLKTIAKRNGLKNKEIMEMLFKG